MRIGTKSVLFGAHCFLLHWFFVALGWWELHRFRRVQIGTRLVMRRMRDGSRWQTHKAVHASLWHPALWAAFFLHDIGYLGKPNMDGDEGVQHPRVGAFFMRIIFGEPWGSFVLYHSRFLAKQERTRPSALCMADKLALAIEPWWLYLPRVLATGEAAEYSFHKRRDFSETKYSADPFNAEERRLASSDLMSDRVKAMQMYMRRWVEEHRDGREDTWTPNTKGVA
jgi:hypothetical protein